MTQEYVKQKALDTITEQQAKTKVNADRDNLLYLMGFNDGVIELALNLQDKSQEESEEREMANVELVIKLNKDITQGIIDGENDAPRNIVRSFQATIADAIKHGVPLPKGHGDLIDRKDLTPDADYEDGIFGAVSCQQIVEAEAIIEADNESEDER